MIKKSIWDYLTGLKFRIESCGIPTTIETHEENLQFIGRQAFQELCHTQLELIPANAYQIFNTKDCGDFARMIFEKLFQGKVGIVPSYSISLRRKIKVIYQDYREEIFNL